MLSLMISSKKYVQPRHRQNENPLFNTLPKFSLVDRVDEKLTQFLLAIQRKSRMKVTGQIYQWSKYSVPFSIISLIHSNILVISKASDNKPVSVGMKATPLNLPSWGYVIGHSLS